MPPARIAKSTIPPVFVQIGRQWMARMRPTSAPLTRYCGAERKSIAFLTNSTRDMRRLHRPRNAAVLADAPEVDRHQEGRDERDPDAVEDVEAQERARANEASAEQAEARVVGRGHELDVADLEQVRGGALDSEQRRGGGHVRADRDGPDRQLVPRQQVSREREEQREDEQDHADDPVELPGRL